MDMKFASEFIGALMVKSQLLKLKSIDLKIGQNVETRQESQRLEAGQKYVMLTHLKAIAIEQNTWGSGGFLEAPGPRTWLMGMEFASKFNGRLVAKSRSFKLVKLFHCYSCIDLHAAAVPSPTVAQA
eukprot:1148527-Pelagomonas_calceolata.AAC.2